MVGAIAMVLALIAFVVAHEAGHFFAAKASKMKVTEFFVGFGPRLWSIVRGETEYGLKAIPAGGYVRIAGMNPFDEVEPEEEERTYRGKSMSQKLFVFLAGIAANFLLAFLILWGIFAFEGEPTPNPTPEVATVVEGSSADVAGVEEGDVIRSIDGVPIDEWDTAAETIETRPGETVTVVVERDGETVELSATLGVSEDGDRGFFGVGPVVDLAFTDVSAVAAVGLAGEEVWELTKQSYGFLVRLVTPSTMAELVGGIGGGEVSAEVRPVSVVGLWQIGSQSAEIGAVNVLYLMASINVILGALNVLPILPLDGGHAAIAIYERVSGRKANLRALAPVAVAVVALFVFIGVLSVLLDVTNPIDLGG
jgi:membrane-associated protease RseP (regulator of RpoE activity)